MYKKLLLICFASIFSIISKGQKAAKSLYFEAGSPGVASINYDMRFNKKDDGLGFRAGFGGVAIDGDGLLAIPIGLNYLVGKDKKNYFEIGTGLTILTTFTRQYLYYGNGNSDYKTQKEDDSFGHIYMGYRYQPKNGGFLFRAGIAPVFSKTLFFPFVPSISFGYKF